MFERLNWRKNKKNGKTFAKKNAKIIWTSGYVSRNETIFVHENQKEFDKTHFLNKQRNFKMVKTKNRKIVKHVLW